MTSHPKNAENSTWYTYGEKIPQRVHNGILEFERQNVSYLPFAPKITLIVFGSRDISAFSDHLRSQTYQNFVVVPCSDLSQLRVETEYAAFLSPDDHLNPQALYQLVGHLNEVKHCDLIFSQSIHETKNGITFVEKPERSLFNLLHWNYVGSFFLFKTEWLKNIKSQNLDAFLYELLLAIFRDSTSTIKRVPYFLHHSSNQEVTKLSQFPELQTLTPKKSPSLLSAVICFKNESKMTLECVRKLVSAAREVPLEIILMNNNSSSDEREKISGGLRALSVRTKLVDFPGAFNFAAMHNEAIFEHCNGELILILNNDVILDDHCEIKSWTSLAMGDEVGTVGIQLRYPGGGIQHAGLNLKPLSTNFVFRFNNAQEKNWLSDMPHEVIGNSFAAAMVKKSVYERLNGLLVWDIPNLYGDTDFALRARAAGLHHYYLPQCSGVHHESLTRAYHRPYSEPYSLNHRFPNLLALIDPVDYRERKLCLNRLSLKNYLKEKILFFLSARTPSLLNFLLRLKRTTAVN